MSSPRASIPVGVLAMQALCGAAWPALVVLWTWASWQALGDYSPRPRADLLLAWPGGPGTAGCIKAAERMGITVLRIGEIVELAARSR